MQLKVNRLKLIAAIEAAAKVKQAKYEKELKEWEASIATQEKRYLQAVEAYAKEAKAGKFLVRDKAFASFAEKEFGIYSTSQLHNNYGKPTRPYLFEDMVEKLKLAEDEELKVDDKTPYFAFLEGAKGGSYSYR